MADAFQRAHPSLKHDVLNKIYIKTLNVRDAATLPARALEHNESSSCRSLLWSCVQSPEELSVVLHHTLRANLESGDVKFIVLDSVAGMFRTDYSGKEQDFSQRSVRERAQNREPRAKKKVPILRSVCTASCFCAAAGAKSYWACPRS